MVQSFLLAFVARLSGLRAVAERCAAWLGTSAFSSLPPALERASCLAFVRRLVENLTATHAPDDEDLVAIDGMALTLPKTQRHGCKKYNRRTVGGGVVWAYQIRAKKNSSPIRVLRLVEGAWHDSKVLRNVCLQPNGPIYLMDRGFYALELLAQWLAQGVHFIVRVKAKNLVYQQLRLASRPRLIGKVFLQYDAVVRLGGERAKAHPVVRLLIAVLPSGEKLILATDRFDKSAEAILAAYRQRWHIERFHHFVKDAVGMAHLYSFDQRGINFLLYTALLLALLLFFSQDNPQGETIQILRALLKALRAALGLGAPWRRNTYSPRRTKTKK
ncbi:MAG: transposase [bacterium]